MSSTVHPEPIIDHGISHPQPHLSALSALFDGLLPPPFVLVFPPPPDFRFRLNNHTVLPLQPTQLFLLFSQRYHSQSFNNLGILTLLSHQPPRFPSRRALQFGHSASGARCFLLVVSRRARSVPRSRTERNTLGSCSEKRLRFVRRRRRRSSFHSGRRTIRRRCELEPQQSRSTEPTASPSFLPRTSLQPRPPTFQTLSLLPSLSRWSPSSSNDSLRTLNPQSQPSSLSVQPQPQPPLQPGSSFT